jgi:phosphoglycolate phosphatase
MTDLYIFDLDGTLVNSVFDLADSVNKVLDSHGYPTHDTEKYKYFVGNGTVKLIERALPEGERTEENIMSLHSEFSEVYRKNALNKTRPYDGIKELLKELKRKGVRLAVASNKPDEFTKEIVFTLLGKDTFDCVRGKLDGIPAKPEPDILYGIMNKLGNNSNNTFMIGDSDVDVITAHNAGLKCIGCTWGFRGRAELENAGADFVCDTPEEILDKVQ